MKGDRCYSGRAARIAWTLLVCVTTGLAFWVQRGIEDLQAASARREAELERFIELRQRAESVPKYDAGPIARKIDQELGEQQWYRDLPASVAGLRPRVVPTEVGLVVRLVEPPRESQR